jgi:outer membrane immunogenic protein
MKKLLLSGVAFTSLIAGPAMAADLGAPVYRRPVAVVADNWSGFYVGGNIGGSLAGISSQDAMSIRGVPPAAMPLATPIQTLTDTHFAAGVLGGGQIGWNWQVSPYLVLGIEADWQWTSQRGDATTYAEIARSGIKQVPNTLDDAQKIPWLGTARARVGWAQNSWLWYATGGVAWSKINSTLTIGTEPGTAADSNIPGGAAAASYSTTKTGWTVGGGVETRLGWLSLGGNWSAKLEYLYVDLGSVTGSLVAPYNSTAGCPACADVLTSSNSIHEHIIRVGLNYKFGYAPVAAITK